MNQPIPIEKLAHYQREARLAAFHRAYENEGAKVPRLAEINRELRIELRWWKTFGVCSALVGLIALVGWVLEVLR